METTVYTWQVVRNTGHRFLGKLRILIAHNLSEENQQSDFVFV